MPADLIIPYCSPASLISPNCSPASMIATNHLYLGPKPGTPDSLPLTGHRHPVPGLPFLWLTAGNQDPGSLAQAGHRHSGILVFQLGLAAGPRTTDSFSWALALSGRTSGRHLVKLAYPYFPAYKTTP
uniref:Uncharacterized protein n=1 Tax=Pipistrellus kuhlii TaxID=59472 RepID=A0A7J7YXW9_PIPKU|nr:hypothetical protein mPipKuh1_009888 [Pipistrellus kuhlii]